MKRTLLLTLLIILVPFLQQENFAQGFGTVDINNISATVNTSGSQFWDLQQTPMFEAPKGSGLHSIYSSNFWIGGLAVSNQLHIAAARFNTNGNKDFFPGPIMNPGAYATESPNWEKVWVLTKAEIQDFVDYYECGIDPNCDQSINFPSYVIPARILDWPAHGDVNLGQAANLAPFIDRNGDGLYSVTGGDIPNIKGDQCAYFILNDDAQLHTESGGEKLGIEIHCMAYSFACINDSALDNTLFMNYRIINRSTLSFTQTYIGIWTDGDLGNAFDDYVGSDVSRGAYYFYNGDSLDENNAGAIGYGADLAAQGVIFLAGTNQNNDGLDNSVGAGANESINGFGYGDGIIDNERLGATNFMYHNNDGTVTGDPTNAQEYYGYLTNQWRDGSPLVYGGKGHNSSCPGTGSGSSGFTCVPAQFMFPGDSDPLGYGVGGATVGDWSDSNSGNTPNDRRGISASGPTDFLSGTEQELDIAYVFARKYNDTTIHKEVEILKERIDSVRSYFNTSYPCYTPIVLSTQSEALKHKLEFKLFPNPVSSLLTLKLTGSNERYEMKIINSLGEVINTKQILSKTTVLNLEHLGSGVYFVELSSDSHLLTKKFTKF